MLFYSKVVAHYNQSGHSHLCNDVIYGHAKTALKNRDVFHPSEVAELMNSVRGISAEFIDHNNQACYFKSGWDNLLDTYFTDLDSSKIQLGYTSCHIFEFYRGKVTIWRDGNSDVEYIHTYLPEESLGDITNDILCTLLGKDKTLETATTS